MPDRSPVAGAEVLAFSAQGAGADPWSRRQELWKGVTADAVAHTDAHGEFQVAGLRPGEYLLRLRGKGFQDEVLEAIGVGPEEDPVIEIVVTPGRVLAGKVFDSAGRGIQGVRLTASTGEGWLSEHHESTSDAGGAFRFASLQEAEYTLRAFPPAGYAAQRLDGLVPDHTDIELRLRRSVRLRGRVLDAESGAGIAGASVAQADEHEAITRRATSDDAGAFALEGLPPSPLRLCVEASGYRSANIIVPAAGAQHEAADPVDMNVQLHRAGVLRGHIEERGGARLAGVEVVLVPERALPPGKTAGVLASTRSAPDGSFGLTFAQVQAESTCVVFARHAECLQHEGSVVQVLDPGRDVGGLVIELERGAAVSGRVTCNDRPVLSVPLRLYRKVDGRSEEVGQLARTIETGEFRFAGLASGEYCLRADASGYSPFASEPRELAPLSELRWDVELERGATVSGWVLDADGEPLRGAQVRAVEFGAERLPNAQRCALSDQEGRFFLASLGRWEYRVEARLRGYATKLLSPVVPPAEGLEVRLDGLGEVAGVVSDAATSEPVTRFWVRLLPAEPGTRTPDPLPQRRFEDPSGAFKLSGVPAGDFIVEVRASGYLAATSRTRVAGGERGARTAYRLERGRRIAVVAADGRGNPVSGARVRALQSFRGRVIERLERSSLAEEVPSTTDAGGRVELSGLKPQSYVIEVIHDDYATGRSGEVTPTSSEDLVTEVRVELQKGASLAGAVRAGDGRALGGGEVLLTGPGGVFQALKIGPDGSFRFSGLVPGRYALQLLRPLEPPGDHVEVEIDAGVEELRVDLEAAHGRE